MGQLVFASRLLELSKGCLIVITNPSNLGHGKKEEEEDEENEEEEEEYKEEDKKEE